MLPNERINSVLNGNLPDRVPFAVYYNKLFPCQIERELRNKGLCIIENGIMPYRIERPNIPERTITYTDENGYECRRRVLETPEGQLSEVHRILKNHPRIPNELLPWQEEYLFKGAEDYAAIRFMIQDQRYVEEYSKIRRLQETGGGDILLNPWLAFSPLVEILINVMGIEAFAVEWHTRRDEVLKLYDVLTLDRRKLYEVVAKSPLRTASYCGNVSSEILGPKRFQEYCIPHYNEFADLMNRFGKTLSIHLDANNSAFTKAIAEARFHIVEAFTPAPSTDMTLAEAREAWPDKILWINFPPAGLLDSPTAVEDMTRKILKEAAPGDRFILGITETVPHPQWQTSYQAIMRVINEVGQLPLEV